MADLCFLKVLVMIFSLSSVRSIKMLRELLGLADMHLLEGLKVVHVVRDLLLMQVFTRGV